MAFRHFVAGNANICDLLFLERMIKELVCKSCGAPVDKESGEMFEGMHWICFHFAYEHFGDPDEPCRSRNCPTWHLTILKSFVEKQGQDPELIIYNEIERVWAQEQRSK